MKMFLNPKIFHLNLKIDKVIHLDLTMYSLLHHMLMAVGFQHKVVSELKVVGVNLFNPYQKQSDG